jgi:hypothetical protein
VNFPSVPRHPGCGTRRGWVTGGIAEAQKLADWYFDEVFKLVFDDNGKLVYPSRLKF